MDKISVDEVKQRLDRGERVVMVDARSAQSWEESDIQIPDSIRIAPDDTDDFTAAIPHDATIVTYCT